MILTKKNYICAKCLMYTLLLPVICSFISLKYISFLQWPTSCESFYSNYKQNMEVIKVRQATQTMFVHKMHFVDSCKWG